MGAANAAVTLARFAAAEVSPPALRGRAISNVVIGGTVGSILGPLVAGPAGQFFKSIAGSELAGAYAISLLAFVLAALVVFMGLRPDPREIGRAVSEKYPEPELNAGGARTAWQIFRQPAALVALLAMLLGQMVMVLLMVITSLHMRNHQHALGDISLVISAHTFGMYAFSILSGRFADRWGRGPVIIFGSAMLAIACLLATLSPAVLPLGVALFFLGLGWNFCYVGGSTLLADQLSPLERAHTQGLNDLLVGLASAGGSLGSGLIFAALGYNVMAFVAAAVAVVPLAAASYWQLRRRDGRVIFSGG
jgi:MFS family permease